MEASDLAAVVSPISKPGWSPLPYEGCVGVEAKGLIRFDNLSLSLLRFREHATIHEHPAQIDVDVVCLEGQGFASVGGAVVALKADETLRWPAGVAHRLWTEESGMTTLMVEHKG